MQTLKKQEMTMKTLEKMSPVQIDWAIAHYVEGWKGAVLHQDPEHGIYTQVYEQLDGNWKLLKQAFAPTASWQVMGQYIDRFHMGLEGNSAWGWRGSKGVGFQGDSPLIAVGRTLLAVATGRVRLSVPVV